MIDSGSTSHISKRKDKMRNYRPAPPGTTITFGLGHVSEPQFMGDIHVATSCGVITLFEVLHVPGAICDLFSIRQAVRMGASAHFETDDKVWVERNGQVLLTGTLRGNLYWVDLALPAAPANSVLSPACRAHNAHVAANARVRESADLWHRRFGHTSTATLAEMVRAGLIQGTKLSVCA